MLWWQVSHSDIVKQDVKSNRQFDWLQELLGLAPRREVRPRGSHLDKREQEELFKRGKAAEEVDPTYAQGERVQGLGYAPYMPWTLTSLASMGLDLDQLQFMSVLYLF
jgi:hypothetical protein